MADGQNNPWVTALAPLWRSDRRAIYTPFGQSKIRFSAARDRERKTIQSRDAQTSAVTGCCILGLISGTDGGRALLIWYSCTRFSLYQATSMAHGARLALPTAVEHYLRVA
eukprot:1172049-Prymnesium_polylepis.2